MRRRSKTERLEVYEIRPSGNIITRDMEVEPTSVMVDRREDEGVLLLNPPSLHYPRMRALPLRLAPHPFAAFFSGDGEAMDMVEGPGSDWRVNPPESDEVDLEETFAPMVAERYNAIDEEASLWALKRVQKGEGSKDPASPYAPLITVAAVAVALVLVLLAYSIVDSRGGLGAAIDIDALFGGGA